MIPTQDPQGLIVLSADASMKLTIEQLLARSTHLGFRSLKSKVVVHPERDPGVFRRSHDFLRNHLRHYRHAITICDRDGCGSEASREEIELQIERHLRVNGLEDRAAAIVIAPELEAWMWGNLEPLALCVGWQGTPTDLKAWLSGANVVPPDKSKPSNPKAALQQVLRKTKKPGSSAIFGAMAATVDTTGCRDEAFLKLKSTLHCWFPR